MKTHNVAQGSTEWHSLRCGIPTASEFDQLLTPEWKRRSGDTPEKYLLRKAAEHFMGYPVESLQSHAMTQGQILEKEALPWYEFTTGEKVQRVGFCTTDDGKIGCSPDGLIGSDGGIEIKCPEPHTHLAYLIAGGVPKQYLAQVHGCMYVTGRKWWKFVSYSRFFPPLVVHVARSEPICEIINATLNQFVIDLQAAKVRVQAIIDGNTQGEQREASAPPSGSPL